ncbi:MAG: hypothetical protein ATN35_07210 [Epulopiscium sp. Nele67-Bin004]|nr:MAG: hypothetical protein ATN35_07210 [Epulopiscium sp. Nele67-Bin004]
MNKKRKIVDRLGLGFIVALSLLLIAVLPVWNIEIENYEVIYFGESAYYSRADIELQMGLTANTHILSVTQDKIEQCKNALPFIEDIEVVKSFPNKLSIIITERTPVAYLPFSGGYLLINKDGIVLAEQKYKAYELPIIEGISISQFMLGQKISGLDAERLLTMETMLKEIEKYDMIKNIDIINISNLQEIHLYIQKLDVIMGNITDFSRKIMWLSNIYENYTVGILDLSSVNSGSAVLRPLE